MDIKKYISHGVPVTWVHVQTEQDSAKLGRPCGQYITLETGPLDKLTSLEGVCSCLAEQLRLFLEPCFGEILCVCGLGNRDMPPDALGPEVARRFQPKMFEAFVSRPSFEKVAMICPGVSGHTNLSSEEMIASIASAIDAACVLVVDASSCRDIERLCSSISLTNNGMRTYWSTADIRQSTVGVPVITIGVPTTIRASALSGAESSDQEPLLTTLHISDVIQAASFIVACAITQVAFPELDYESCKQYIGFFLNNII